LILISAMSQVYASLTLVLEYLIKRGCKAAGFKKPVAAAFFPEYWVDKIHP